MSFSSTSILCAQNTKNDDRRGSKATTFTITAMFKVPTYIKLQKTKEECFDLWENHFKKSKRRNTIRRDKLEIFLN